MLGKIFNSNKPKIFCISFQRTGTTSIGGFFKNYQYKVADYFTSKHNNWSLNWFSGNFEAIFESEDFQKCQVFEDNPWWYQDFYKYLFHKFPRAKFILFKRNPDQWFDSMLSHSKGMSLGNTHRHAHIYQRENEFEEQFAGKNVYSEEIDNLLPISESLRSHYISIYNTRHAAIETFFKTFGKDRIIVCELEDKDKWIKLGQFFNIAVDSSYDLHANKS